VEGLDPLTGATRTELPTDRGHGAPAKPAAPHVVALSRARQLRPLKEPVPCCRVCGAALARTLVDLGQTPLANAFVTPAQALLGLDRAWNLHVRVCDVCLLAQLDTVVPPAGIFSDYIYFSSVSSSWVEHARRYAGSVIRRFGLHGGSLVVEVASNDGYLLQHFIAAGVPALGIEPAANIAAVARNRGVPTEVAFFGAATAAGFAQRGLHADLLVANNVLAHVPDVTGFISGVARLLAQNGVATFEFPHLLRLIEDVQFDTIYHEHYAYFSLLVVGNLLRAAGLRAFDVEELPTHGGSLRVFICHAAAAFAEQPGVALVLAAEREARLDRPEGYAGFAPRVAQVQRGFRAFLAAERRARRRVAGYGAAAKASTLLNTCGVTEADMAFIVDRNPAKQFKLVPGCHIPVLPPDTLLVERPENVVILPWNLAEEIARELEPLRAQGTRLWVAIPELRPV
jgi:SAM-dependent methyltransferase